MSKGSQPAGSVTQTTTNPTQAAQLPYLQQGWGSAQNLYNQQPVMPYYPGATMAPWNPAVQTGYEGIYNTGAGNVAQGLQPNATNAYNTALSGGYGANNSPAYGAYQQFMAGTNPYQQQLGALANSAAGGNLGLSTLGGIAQGQGAGMQQLGQTASGYYLNSNPYLAAMVQAAADPVTRNYQTATAPQADYNFANAGRYGSGAMAGLRSTNEQNLGKTLADQSSNLYGQNYANERARQDAAAAQYAGLQNQAGQGYGSLYNQGLQTSGQALNNLLASQQYGATGLQGAYQSGNAAAMSALGQYPQFAQAQFIPARAQLEAGQGLTQMTQAQISDQMKRYYGEQAAPWDTLAKYMSSIGQYTSGSSSSQTPYFQNQMANLLSGGAGALGIGQQLFGGSSGGLLGGLGGTAGGLSPAAWSVLEGLPASAGGTAAGAGAFEGLAGAGISEAGLMAAAPAAAGFTVICTELVRQGKMPNKWRLAGMRAFMRYPEAARRGYSVWAVPSVRHLRRHPDSLYSRCLTTAFLWRSEDLAARAGVRGARRLWRGRAVTAAIALPCLVLGMLYPKREWRAPYCEDAVA
jgi:hypothetical protein